MNKVAWYLALFCTALRCLATPESFTAKNYGEQLIHDIIKVWSIVNKAHSISPGHSDRFNDEIFDASLELYGKMYSAVLSGYTTTSDTETVTNMLHALQYNHDNLCNQQHEIDCNAIKRLMTAIYVLNNRLHSSISTLS